MGRTSNRRPGPDFLTERGDPLRPTDDYELDPELYLYDERTGLRYREPDYPIKEARDATRPRRRSED